MGKAGRNKTAFVQVQLTTFCKHIITLQLYLHLLSRKAARHIPGAFGRSTGENPQGTAPDTHCPVANKSFSPSMDNLVPSALGVLQTPSRLSTLGTHIKAPGIADANEIQAVSMRRTATSSSRSLHIYHIATGFKSCGRAQTNSRCQTQDTKTHGRGGVGVSGAGITPHTCHDGGILLLLSVVSYCKGVCFTREQAHDTSAKHCTSVL